MQLLVINDGMLSLLDNIARAVVHSANPRVFLVSGVASMQTFDSSSKFLEALFHMISAIMFPVALGMSLPLFMYLAVLEKHSRVKSIMQMHGLRETNYWIANILLNLGLFLAIYATFHFFGAYVFKMPAFTGTSSIILV